MYKHFTYMFLVSIDRKFAEGYEYICKLEISQAYLL